MEDISRELEKEIARIKPAPYKTNKNRTLLIVDDFGTMRPGGYIRTLAWFFFIVSLLGGLGACGLYYVYHKADTENAALKYQLNLAQKKVNDLTREKELLMARMVVSGKEKALSELARNELKPEPKPDTAKTDDKAGMQMTPALADPPEPIVESGLAGDTEPVQLVIRPKVEKEKQDGEPGPDGDEPLAQGPEITAAASQQAAPDASGDLESEAAPVVAIQKFRVVQGRKDELKVKFNIMNVSTRDKEVSGRIFTVLKLEDHPEKDWVVIPSGSIDGGVPGPYQKGQYFSISRFKPVSFTFKHSLSPDQFKLATVYIFGDDERLIYQNDIQINGEQ